MPNAFMRSRAGLSSLALTLSLCLPCPAAGAGAASEATPGSVGGAETLHAINQARAQAGLPALQADHRLAVLAQAHSAHMARQQRLSHDGFEQRRHAAGGGRCVENVAQGLNAPGPLVAAWLANGGHRRNLLAPGLRAAGVASDAGFVTFLACD